MPQGESYTSRYVGNLGGSLLSGLIYTDWARSLPRREDNNAFRLGVPGFFQDRYKAVPRRNLCGAGIVAGAFRELCNAAPGAFEERFGSAAVRNREPAHG